jgi:glyoxylase-like metal-dependent hydrolase (beta-lactamase superfamily II)
MQPMHAPIHPLMLALRSLINVLAAVATLALSAAAAGPQAKAGVERLYILNCGEGVAGDVSRWSPGVNVGKSAEFVDNCYLIRHSQGWLLWDTGVADAIAAMPQGQAPSDPRATHWRRPKTLASQLGELSVKPADIKFLAVSHTHPDHVGNVGMFATSMLLVQKAEYEWPSPLGVGRFKPEHPVTKLEGDHDVFGDGSVIILSTPGHTPGHQSLLVKMPKTGAVVLSGDAVHFADNWENRRVPELNTDKDKTLASMQRIADVIAQEHAQLWINHDKAQRDRLKMAPDYYD